MPLVMIVWLASSFGNSAHSCDMSVPANKTARMMDGDHACCTKEIVQPVASELLESCQIQSDCECAFTAADPIAVPNELSFRISVTVNDLATVDLFLSDRYSSLDKSENRSYPPSQSPPSQSAPALHLQHGVFLN